MKTNIENIFNQAIKDNQIDNQLYKTYDVKKGLRNEDNTGVLVGLTQIADVVGYARQHDQKIETAGELYYRGYEITDLIHSLDFSLHDGFERVAFLILFGHLADEIEIEIFKTELRNQYELPKDFLELNILRNPSKNLMNQIQQAILMLYGYDENSDDITPLNTLNQGMSIIAKMPCIVAYAYQSNLHHHENASLVIHKVNSQYGMAQSILHLTRQDHHFSELEAQVLDCMLILHMDHGGGNNSTFTNVVIASTGTDLYSSLVGSIGALKGPRHGGASLAVCEMMKSVTDLIGYTEDEAAIRHVIQKILNKDFFDQSGLVYGIGHAVYTLSDPRSEILQVKAKELAVVKGMEKEFHFYQRFERIAVEEIFKLKGKHVSSNVDFYSGLVYKMLDIPQELVSPLFVNARIVGWIAHNIEDKLYSNKIVRPATKYVGTYRKVEEK